MDLTITEVPAWLSLLFVLSFLTAPIFLIGKAMTAAAKRANLKQYPSIRKNVVIFYWTYLAIVAAVSLSGFFAKNVLPPRIIIFTAIPLVLFYLLYVQRSTWFKTIFEHIKLEELIYIHLFRFVGVFFLFVYMYDALPQTFAYAGGGGDILTALLVFPVIWALRKGFTSAKAFVWIWNIIGLLDIITVIALALVITQKAVNSGGTGVLAFATFPFSWIPAFAPPTIIFLHVLVFRKLLSKKSQG